MEATYRTQIGATAGDIFKMTWREFRVLFDHFFTEDPVADEPEEFDWESALDRSIGRETSSSRIPMSLEDFMKAM